MPLRRVLLPLAAVVGVLAASLLPTAASAAPTSSCPGVTATRVVPVATVAALKKAVFAAKPGDSIEVAAGRYDVAVMIQLAGTAAAPIALCGAPGASIVGPGPSSKNGIYLRDAPHWRVSGLEVSGFLKGVMVENSPDVQLSRLSVHDIGNEAVHFRQGSSDGSITGSTVFNTGLTNVKYGEGVYVGSAYSNWETVNAVKVPDLTDRVRVADNRIGPGVPAEPIDLKEGTTGGVVTGNVMDGSSMLAAASANSWIDVKGNGYTVTGNTGSAGLLNGYQTYVARPGWGNANVFSGNLALTPLPGFVVQIATNSTGNVVRCPVPPGYTNVPCT